MKKLFIILVFVSFTLNSCTKNEKCLNCFVLITTDELDAGEIVYSTPSMDNIDLCGSQLQSVLDNPSQVITIESEMSTTRTTSLYLCE